MAKKFDLYKVVRRDFSRGASMCGVKHEDGHKIATDGKQLAYIREAYDASLEGKTILKSGLDCSDQNYPNYKRVFPDFKELEEIAFDLDSFEKALKSKELKLLEKVSKIFKNISKAVEVGGVFVSYDFMKNALAFVRAYPKAKSYIWKKKDMFVFLDGTEEDINAMYIFLPYFPETVLKEGFTEYAPSLYFSNDVVNKCWSVESILKVSKNEEVLLRQEAKRQTEKDTELLGVAEKLVAWHDRAVRD